MLTEKQYDFTLKNASEWYHLPDCNSHIFGEPFLEEDYIYYFDGRVITIITERIGRKTDLESLNLAINSIAKKHDPESMIVWGEVPSKEIIDIEGYKSNKREIPIWKNEMRFNTKDFKPTHSFKKVLRKAKNLGLEIRFEKPKFYKSEYTKLLAQTHENLLGLKSLSYYSIFPHLPYVKFAETYKDGKIASVHVLFELLPNYVVLAEIGYRPDIPQISAMAKVLLMEHYMDKAQIISLGGCENEGIFDHKKKFIGDIPFYSYPEMIWYEFYKNEPLDWWLKRMAKS